MNIQEIQSIKKQKFLEYVRQGLGSAPEVLSALRTGETTAQDQAKAYFDADETEGLSIAEAKEAIEKALESPAY